MSEKVVFPMFTTIKRDVLLNNSSNGSFIFNTDHNMLNLRKNDEWVKCTLEEALKEWPGMFDDDTKELEDA